MHELRNRNNRIAGLYCEKHSQAALQALHQQELDGTFAPNGDGRIGAGDAVPMPESTGPMSPSPRGDSDKEQAA